MMNRITLLTILSAGLLTGCPGEVMEATDDTDGSDTNGDTMAATTLPVTTAMTTMGMDDSGSGDTVDPDDTAGDTMSMDTGMTDDTNDTGMTEDTGMTDTGATDTGATDTGATDTGMTTTNGTTGGMATCDTGYSLVPDGGFEAGVGGGTWTEASDNFGTPLCDLAGCGAGGGTGPFAGTFWAWFGGAGGVDENASVEQDVVIPAEAVTMAFQFELPVSDQDGMDTLAVLIDGDTVFSATDGDFGSYDTYTLVEVDISAYADDASHTLRIEGFTTGDEVTNFFVDNVSFCDPDAGGSTGTDTGSGTDTGTTTAGGTCPEVDAGTATGLDIAMGSTVGAGDDETISCAMGGGDDVTIIWEAPAAGDYGVSLSGSDFDTALGLFDMCGGTENTCNDDITGSFFDSSLSGFNLCGVAANETFVFSVEGYAGDTGNYNLNIIPRVDGMDCCDDTSMAGGCSVLTIETCVCGIDDYCCDTEWDTLCVAFAELGCGADCGSCT